MSRLMNMVRRVALGAVHCRSSGLGMFYAVRRDHKAEVFLAWLSLQCPLSSLRVFYIRFFPQVPLLHSTGHPLGCPSSDTVCWLWKMVKKSRAFRSGQLGNIRVLRSVKGQPPGHLSLRSIHVSAVSALTQHSHLSPAASGVSIVHVMKKLP
ncbi:uncharacterized protein [Saccopteryx bilineata]|uniref:uncharacterized protein isoform X3 n=1 Tax=Saccopteryx bilineata TaxID=59482 RepID=UPI00338ED480